ncbi:MAG: prephenate dehydratase, partial [Pirellulales bacterium]|nr:prephenate dehydratase [Pirellulales bacterium]
LGKLRKEIDSIDKKLLGLLNSRGGIALKISELKRENSYNIYDPVREKEIEKKLARLNEGPLSADSVLSVYREIISACRKLQEPLKVAFLGPVGSFSHQAAFREFGASNELVPLGGFDEVFKEVETGRADFAVIPVENSVEGSVGAVLDLLSRSELLITNEIFERVHHFLLSKSKSLRDIKVVASHPQALAQCRRWTGKNLSHAEAVEVASTAEAARLASRRKGYAAIASEYAAEIYKLRILKKNIEDSSQNTTRFFVLGHSHPPPSGDDRTSIVFSLKDKPGALQKSFFQPFAEESINLSKIESRPSKERPWEYLFFVDFEGHSEDPGIKKILSKL